MAAAEPRRNQLFDTVTILGMGLLGRSLGIVVRERRLARRVVGVARREETARQALALGAADEVTLDGRHGVRAADLVVLAVPVLSTAPLVEAVASCLRPGAVVTDVGSTKAYLQEAIPPLLPAGAAFVGGHPMAGSEQAGIGAARADLYDGAAWVLTRSPGSERAALERVAALARAVGARPVEMDAAEHDAIVARVSHLPHLAAAALAAAALDPALPLESLRQLPAGGFRDTTRVAASPAEMWRDVCLTNAGPILAALDCYEAQLAAFRRAIEQNDGDALVSLFAEGAAARETLLDG